MKLCALLKKEFHRFFHDPRLIVTIVLPGIVIFLLYTFLGNIVHSDESRQYTLQTYGGSAVAEILKGAVEESGSELSVRAAESKEAGERAVKEGEAHVFLAFSEGFDLSPVGATVEIWYDVADEDSLALFQIASSFLQNYGLSAIDFTLLSHSVSPEEEFGRSVMASLLPFLVVTFVFSACMSVTLESIAGEKERGTLGTILATSVPRYQIALGKILPLSAIAAIGAASSFLGVIFSMPKLMGTTVSSFFTGFGAAGYLCLLLAIMSFVPLIVAAISAVSTYSKSVKEASAYTGVIMIFVMVLSLAGSFLELGEWVAAIPVLNAVMVTERLLAGEVVLWQTFVAVGVNLAVTALLVWLVAKMLSSERIMFGK